MKIYDVYMIIIIIITVLLQYKYEHKFSILMATSMFSFGWGKKNKEQKYSEFFEGHSLLNTINKSLFGDVNFACKNFISEDELLNFVLPDIIVIGSESSGKSSLLENITKCSLFPKDNKLCTKCPIHIKMSSGKSNKYTLTIEGKVKNIDDKNKFHDEIAGYMKTIPSDVKDTEIIVEIIEPGIPSFEFYDLPGLRSYPPDLCEATTNLCRKYLKNKDAIVLCVIPATTTRLTACQNIALITEMGVQKNTIMALTMIDRLQEDTIEDLLLKRITKKTDELEGLDFAGYIAVVNKSLNSNVSLSGHDYDEELWFNNKILANIEHLHEDIIKEIKNNVTVKNLTRKIDELYCNYIKQYWKPKILDNLKIKIDQIESNIGLLGSNEFSCDEYNKKIDDFMSTLYASFVAETQSVILGGFKFNANIDHVDDFYEKKKVIDSKYKYYLEYDGFVLVDQINKYFETETEMQLSRFEKLKNIICKNILDSIKISQETKVVKHIYKKVISKLEDDFISYSVNDQMEYERIFDRLFGLYVLFPTFCQSKPEFTKDDYEESESYKIKRQTIYDDLEKLKQNYSKIESI